MNNIYNDQPDFGELISLHDMDHTITTEFIALP